MKRYSNLMIVAATLALGTVCSHTRATNETQSHTTIRAIESEFEDGTAIGNSMECADAVAYGHNQGELWVGYAGGRYLFAGFRFQGLRVARGAKVTSASLALEMDAIYGGGTTGVFYGDDVDDAQGFVHGESYPQCIDRTVAHSTFDGDELGTYSIDVTAIVQGIIDRPGWRSGNAIQFAVFPTEGAIERAFGFAEFGDASMPVLMINWEAPGESLAGVAESRLMAEPTDVLTAVLMKWGTTCRRCTADLTMDGRIDTDDLLVALSMLD